MACYGRFIFASFELSCWLTWIPALMQPGVVEGTVTKIITKPGKHAGKQVKASEDEPSLLLKSVKSGKPVSGFRSQLRV